MTGITIPAKKRGRRRLHSSKCARIGSGCINRSAM